MARAQRHSKELKNTGYEIFVGILSILSILNLILLYAINDADLDTILWVMNALLKILRVFRLWRVVRLLREYGARNIARSLIKDRAGSALFTLLLLGILVLEFGSLEILHIEQYAPGANITTGSDAFWYVIVTISTVGYGDQYPVTNEGRFFGSVIIIIGVGIFGTFTGYLANLFLSPAKKATAT